jgi:hypothetical protein
VEPFEASLPPDLAQLRDLHYDLSAWLERVGVTGGDRDAIVLATHTTLRMRMDLGREGVPS